MANMFSGNTEKKIPKSIDDCIKPDNTSTNLWFWCEQLEKWGKILFWIIIISGIILSITPAIEINKETKGIYYTYTDTEMSFSFELLINSLLDTAIYAFIEYCTYHVIALLIGALASIVQHNKITANVALYNATRNSEQNKNDTHPSKNKTESDKISGDEPEASEYVYRNGKMIRRSSLENDNLL